jgi:hypothetical protein
LYNQEYLERINFFLEKIELVKKKYDSKMPEDVECVLHLDQDKENGTVHECYYYLVDHANRILFWMDDFVADHMIAEVDSAKDPMHISTFFPAILTRISHVCRV